jgi:2-octaprenyl-6-methoxyphenol hydroxylase
VQPDSDCLVIGAGLVGSIAALALAELGLRVCVLEQRAPLDSNISKDARALVLSAASQRILERYQVWSRLLPLACPIRDIRVSERGAFGSVDLCADEIGLEALGWACPADRLLATFNAVMLEHERISVRWLTRFVSARADGHEVRVETNSKDSIGSITTRLLIGADGAESAVREASGIMLERLDYAQRAIVANVSVARPRPHTAFEHFTRRGPLAFIPLGDARYVSVQCLDDSAASNASALDESAYLAMLGRRFGERLGAFSDLGPRHSYRLARQRARPLDAARTLIIGNAANTVHPNAAQGLNLGLRDVAILAQCLRGADDPGAATALSRYSQLRRRDHFQTGAFTDALAQGFRSRLPLVTCVRRAALTLTAYVAPVRRRLMLDASGLLILARAARAA